MLAIKHVKISAAYDLKLLRLLFRLADNEEYCNATFPANLKNIINAKTDTSEMSIIFERSSGQLTALLASYVEETRACGKLSFSKIKKEHANNLRSSQVNATNRNFLVSIISGTNKF